MSGIRAAFEAIEPALPWLVGGSIVTMVVTPVLTAWLIARIPADYFLHRRAPLDGWRRSHPVLRWGGLLLKNLLGLLFLLAGVAMLVLPGQGMLSIVLGVVLLDFPGKRRLQLRILRMRWILRSINWIRTRRGRDPLRLPIRLRGARRRGRRPRRRRPARRRDR